MADWTPWRDTTDANTRSRLVWFDCSVCIRCVCGAEIILIDDEDGKACYDCGRTYRLLARIETKEG